MGKIFKGLMFNNEISVSLLDTTDITNTAIKNFGLSPVCTATLGRALTVVSFMSSCLKNDTDSVTITISGDGLGGQVVVCGDADMGVRGYIDNPHVDIPLKPNGKLDVATCVGKGRITVVKNLGLKTPYTGSSRIVSGEIAEDFATYYTYSEQQPTALALGVLVATDCTCQASGGLVLQPLPNASDESIEKCEKLIAQFTSISAMIAKSGVNRIIGDFFADVDFVEYNTNYKCNCSKDRIDRVLLTLGKAELDDIVKRDGQISVECHFCPKVYTYKQEDVDKLFND